MPNEPLSPITLSVLWNGFLSIAEEMGTTLQMTAFSEAVREGQDFSTAIFDRQGRLVAQGNFTPGHLGSMPYVIKSVMEVFPPGSLQPGDGVLLNDSKLGSGHYPDFFFVSPVFLGHEQIGYLINTAHHIDVGGAAPGSQRVQGITERFQEGLRILPIRIMRGGRVRRGHPAPHPRQRAPARHPARRPHRPAQRQFRRRPAPGEALRRSTASS